VQGGKGCKGMREEGRREVTNGRGWEREKAKRRQGKETERRVEEENGEQGRGRNRKGGLGRKGEER